MAKGFVFTEEDDKFLLGGIAPKQQARPKAEENKKRKPVFLFSEEDDAFLFGEDYGTTQERAGAKPSGSDVASVAPVQGREGSVSQPDRKPLTPLDVVDERMAASPRSRMSRFTKEVEEKSKPWDWGALGESMRGAAEQGVGGWIAATGGDALDAAAQAVPGGALIAPAVDYLFDKTGLADKYQEVGTGIAETGKIRQELAAPNLVGREDYGRYLLQQALVSSPNLALSLLAGRVSPAAGMAIAGGMAGGAGYAERKAELEAQAAAAKESLGYVPEHLSPENIERAASEKFVASAVSEGALEALPILASTGQLGKFLGEAGETALGGAVKDLLDTPIGRLLATGGAEAGTETGTEAANIGYEVLREGKEVTPQQAAERLQDAAAIGGIAGTAVQVPFEAVRGAQAAKDQLDLARMRSGIRPAKPKVTVDPTPAAKIPEILPRVDIQETADGKFRVAQKTASGEREAIFSNRKDAEAYANRQQPTAPDVAQEAKPNAPSKNSLKRAKADVADRLVNDPEFASIALADPAVLSVEEVRLARQYDVEIEAKKAQAKAEAPAPTPVAEPVATPAVVPPTTARAPLTRQDMLRDSPAVAPPATPTGPLTPEMRRARMQGLSRAEFLGMRPEATTTQQEPVATAPATTVAPAVTEAPVEAPSELTGTTAATSSEVQATVPDSSLELEDFVSDLGASYGIPNTALEQAVKGRDTKKALDAMKRSDNPVVAAVADLMKDTTLRVSTDPAVSEMSSRTEGPSEFNKRRKVAYEAVADRVDRAREIGDFDSILEVGRLGSDSFNKGIYGKPKAGQLVISSGLIPPHVNLFSGYYIEVPEQYYTNGPEYGQPLLRANGEPTGRFNRDKVLTEEGARWVESQFLQRVKDDPSFADKLREQAASFAKDKEVDYGALAGVYKAGTNEVIVQPQVAGNEEILAHELVHAQADRALRRPSARQKPYVERLKKLYDHVSTKLDKKDWYGLKDIHEFLSEGMSNPEFQFELSRIQYERSSAWTKFTQYVAGLVGIKHDNAFVELLEVYQGIAGQPKMRGGKPVIEQNANQTQETTNGLQQIQEGQRTQGRGQEAVEVSQPEQGDDTRSFSPETEGFTPNPVTQARTGVDLVRSVADGNAKDVTPELQSIANELLSSPNLDNVKVRVADVDPDASSLTTEDGRKAAGAYTQATNTITLRPGSSTVTAVHEAAHAATVNAMSAVEAGLDKRPEAVAALEQVKKATRILSNIRTGDPKIDKRIQYAATNPLEAIAVLRSEPAIVAAVNASGNTAPVEGVRTRLEDNRSAFRRFFDTMADAVLKFLRLSTPTRGKYITEKFVKEMLLGDAMVEYSRLFEKTDARGVTTRIKSVKEAGDRLRQNTTGVDKNMVAAPNAAPNATPPTNPPDVTEGFTNKDKAVRVLQRLFRASGEGSQTVFEMTQRAGGIVSAWQNEMQNAMISAYDRLGSRAKIYNDEMVKYFRGQPAKLPKDVRDALDEMRMVRKKAVIALVASGVIKDRRTRARLLESADYYTHRSYAAWQLPKGEWSEIMRAPGGRFQEVFESVADQIVDDIRLGTPDTIDDMYSKMTSKDQPKKVQKLIEDVLRFKFYAHGITNPSNKAEWEVAIARLKAAAVTQSTDPEALKSMAKDIAKRVLDPKADRVEERDVQKYMRTLGVDSTALKDRTGVRPWMRELWGEYKELDAIAFDTITNLAGIIAREQAMRTYKQELLDKKILIPGDAGSKSGYQQLKSDDRSYGPFEGLWIRDQDSGIVNMIASQNVMDAVMQYNNMLMGGALGSALSTVGGYTKTAAILQDHTAMMNNMLSTATVLTLAAGNPFVWAKLPKAVGIARRTDLRTIPVLGKATKITDAQIAQDIKFLAEQNVLFDAALTQDLREEISFAIRDESYLNAPKLKRRLFKAKVAVGRFQDNLSRLNAAGDTIGKVMVFYAKIPALQLVYPEKSLQEIRQIAASEIRDQMPSYSRAMPLARAVSRQGLFAPFATFYSEMIRNTANDGKLFWKYAKMAVTEKNPAAAAYASLIGAGSVAKHTAIYAAHAGLAGLAFWAYSMFAEDEEDEELIEQIKQAQTAFRDNYIDVRKLAGEHVRGDIIPLRALGEFKYRVAVTNRMDPSTVGATLSSWEKGDDAGTILSTFLSGLSGLSIPAQEAVRAFTSSEEDRMENIGWSILRMFSPGAGTRLVINPMEDERKGRDPLNSFELNLESMGFRLQDIDAAESLVRHSRESAQPIRTATRDLNDALNPKIKTRGEFYLNMDAVAAAYNGVVNSYVEAYDKVYPVIGTARNLGMSNAQIFDAIKKENTGLSDDFIWDTINGRIRFPHPSKLLENKLEPERKKARTRQEQDRITAKFLPEFKRANELYEEAVERAEKLGIPVVGGKK